MTVRPGRAPAFQAFSRARARAARNASNMRIRDLDPAGLCDRHLLGEHRELHAVWSILTTDKRGNRSYPETMRWRGRLAALCARHEAQVAEMRRRGRK